MDHRGGIKAGSRRLPALRAELGDVKSVDVLTGRAESDKICLVRVQLY